MLTAAQRLRGDSSQPLNADLLMATAYLWPGEPPKVLKQLQPYLDAAWKCPRTIAR